MADLEGTLIRLQKGQKWLTNEFRELLAMEEWPPDREEMFWKGFETWIELEKEVRTTWSFDPCVIGPGSCNKDAPIICDVCAGRLQKPRVAICTRESRPVGQSQQSDETMADKQTSLFPMGRRHDL